MNIKEIIKQPEGRRLEFKETLPENADLANTIIAFANDAGGELYIGIRNNPREIVGLPEEELVKIEEQISNIIFDRCYPAILPDITFLTELELVKKVNGTEYPTNALVLFSDDDLRRSLFPFVKVECARFKGVTSDEFIDQKSILTNIATQAEEAYNFVLRHINKGAVVEGV